MAFRNRIKLMHFPLNIFTLKWFLLSLKAKNMERSIFFLFFSEKIHLNAIQANRSMQNALS
jgi:hypothetical protein